MSCPSCGGKINWFKRQQLKAIRKILKRHPRTSVTLPKIKGLCPNCARTVMQNDLSSLMNEVRGKDIPPSVMNIAEKTVRGEIPKVGDVKREIKKVEKEVKKR